MHYQSRILAQRGATRTKAEREGSSLVREVIGLAMSHIKENKSIPALRAGGWPKMKGVIKCTAAHWAEVVLLGPHKDSIHPGAFMSASHIKRLHSWWERFCKQSNTRMDFAPFFYSLLLCLRHPCGIADSAWFCSAIINTDESPERIYSRFTPGQTASLAEGSYQSGWILTILVYEVVRTSGDIKLKYQYGNTFLCDSQPGNVQNY